MIKMLFVFIVFVSCIFSIILVQRLPIRGKSLKWNLNARFYLYAARDIIIFVSTIILMHTLPNELKEPGNAEIVAIIAVFIISFTVDFLSDIYAVKKRLYPYAKIKQDEYNEYIETEKKFAYWNTLEYSTFFAVITTIFSIIIISG